LIFPGGSRKHFCKVVLNFNLVPQKSKA
jgi:hypothetical protein